ncbi:MAG: hypothetical protein IJ733_07525 [Lachnospiraceae bacterium]|nr:hypothetical protein [Lachnospiraceae bacterium]
MIKRRIQMHAQEGISKWTNYLNREKLTDKKEVMDYWLKHELVADGVLRDITSHTVS